MRNSKNIEVYMRYYQYNLQLRKMVEVHDHHINKLEKPKHFIEMSREEIDKFMLDNKNEKV